MSCGNGTGVEDPPPAEDADFQVFEAPLKDHYEVQEVIGSGGFGTVSRAKCDKTGEMFVVKSIPFDKFIGNVAPEVELLPKLRHPSIVAVREAIRDDRCLHLVMEYCEGGSLTRRIEPLMGRSQQPGDDGIVGLPPWLVNRYLCQLLSAVAYLHGNQCVHRDIKGQNVLLTTASDNNAALRLADFGCCCRFTPGVYLKQRVGSLQYVAPEVLSHRYTEKCDVWSSGVLAFYACVGYKPFTGITEEEATQSIRDGTPTFRRCDWQSVPIPLQELVRDMLTKDIDERPSADSILEQSPWLSGNTPRCGCLVM